MLNLKSALIRSKRFLYVVFAMTLISFTGSRSKSSERSNLTDQSASSVTSLFLGTQSDSKCKVPLGLTLYKGKFLADVDGYSTTHEDLVRCIRSMDEYEDEIAIYISVEGEAEGAEKVTMRQISTVVRRILKAAAEAGATKKLRLGVIFPEENEERRDKITEEKNSEERKRWGRVPPNRQQRILCGLYDINGVRVRRMEIPGKPASLAVIRIP